VGGEGFCLGSCGVWEGKGGREKKKRWGGWGGIGGGGEVFGRLEKTRTTGSNFQRGKKNVSAMGWGGWGKGGELIFRGGVLSTIFGKRKNGRRDGEITGGGRGKAYKVRLGGDNLKLFQPLEVWGRSKGGKKEKGHLKKREKGDFSLGKMLISTRLGREVVFKVEN